jgi:hypothetical protein
MTGDTTPQDLAREINDYLAEGWSGPRDRALLEKAAGLLCSSPVVQPERDEDGSSLRSSKPSAAGEAQWAVLRADDDEIYSSRDSAEHVLRFLLEGNMDYRLYEIREVRS